MLHHSGLGPLVEYSLLPSLYDCSSIDYLQILVFLSRNYFIAFGLPFNHPLSVATI